MNPIADASPAPPAARPDDGPLWRADPDGSALQFAEVEVPLDYEDPDGEHITVAVGRIPALDPAKRRGVLVAFNGGPGGHNAQGRFMPLRLAGTAVHEVYDLVGFDTRGWGASAPVLREVVQGKAPWSSRPADEDFAQIAEDVRATEEGAARAGGTLRAHITTRNVARDLDRIRVALGEDRISLLAYADATYPASVYGTLFGEHVDRHVFDSSVDPGGLWRGQYMAQAEAIRANVDVWAAWVGERDGVFGLGGDGDAVIAGIEETAAALHAEPFCGLDRTFFDGIVGNGAQHRPLWDQLADTVRGLRDRNHAAVEAAWLFAASEWEQPAPGQTHTSGLVEAITAEAEWPTDLETYFADMRLFRERYPYGNGVMRAQPWVVAFREDKPREPMTRVTRERYGPGLVVHAAGNPMLSHAGGAAMAALVDDRLVTVEDDGSNEMFAVRGNAAVDALVTGYLVDGRLPEADVTVPGTPRPAVDPARAAGSGPRLPDTEHVKHYLTEYRAAAKRR
ncbi:alpha/beta hydrolase [Streptomyces sp. MB09-02B]|uniref:alpha/beta hydrolase n=1 Tax=Streptomyces sp. MB09-02B TaxID=3028667 RepID=UPI0029B3E79F|nr:alpha/beta hydrolase [Streptomyces sp. MB09-02B]MDX3641165.1 alpha/beta fold hydrolase [Streptomyces sp. MB09-02B]